MAKLRPISIAQYRCTFSGVATAYFTRVTAPKESRDRANYNDGTTGTTYTTLSFTRRDPVTLTKPFDPVEDKALIDWYRKQERTPDEGGFEVSIQPVKADLEGNTIEGAGTFILTGCKVVSFTMPEMDRSGTTAVSTLSIEVDFDTWMYQ